MTTLTLIKIIVLIVLFPAINGVFAMLATRAYGAGRKMRQAGRAAQVTPDGKQRGERLVTLSYVWTGAAWLVLAGVSLWVFVTVAQAVWGWGG